MKLTRSEIESCKRLERHLSREIVRHETMLTKEGRARAVKFYRWRDLVMKMRGACGDADKEVDRDE